MKGKIHQNDKVDYNYVCEAKKMVIPVSRQVKGFQSFQTRPIIIQLDDI